MEYCDVTIQCKCSANLLQGKFLNLVKDTEFCEADEDDMETNQITCKVTDNWESSNGRPVNNWRPHNEQGFYKRMTWISNFFNAREKNIWSLQILLQKLSSSWSHCESQTLGTAFQLSYNLV